MNRWRSVFLVVAILGLLALAAFGIRQVIVGQETPQPLSDEERQHLEQTADAAAREAVRQFIDSAGNPCSVRLSEFSGEFVAPYPDLPALINDADLIVTGRPTENVLLPPEHDTLAGRIVTTVQVDDVLSGAPSGPTVTVDLGNRVMQSGANLIRFVASGLDPCAGAQVLLFLERRESPDVFGVGYQGWAHVEGPVVEAAPFNKLFQSYTTGQTLLDGVRLIAHEQQAQGLPKGLLLCRAEWALLQVCPGDTFNPYEAFQLQAVREAFVVTSDAGPSPLAVRRTNLEPGSGQLSALLSALDVEVAIEPLSAEPDDLLRLNVLPTHPLGGHDGFVLQYSPSAGVVQVSPYGGQFDAPPAFEEAMKPFLATAPAR